MSELYTVDVLNRGVQWVDLRVTQCHPDAGSFPESPGFALQLLLDQAYQFDDSYQRVPAGPLGEAVPVDDFYDAELAVERAKQFIDSVQIYKVINAPFVEKDAHAWVDRKVLARGIARDSEEWESAWQDHWREYWLAVDGPPVAHYRVKVKEPKWVEHLQPGKHFDSAGYCPEGPWVAENRDTQLATPGDAVVPADRLDFPLCQVPRGETAMNHELIRSLTKNAAALEGAALAEAVAAHELFVKSGGAGGDWQTLEAAGMPLCMYDGAADEGTQLVMRLKRLGPGASLEGKNLSSADFSGCTCEGARFGKAQLDGSVAIDSFFDGADFSGASLQKVDFSRASLKGCSFRGANLRGADFENADLTGADFTGAVLVGSRFPGAILEGVKR
ncbi:MAG: pentapeptide repeat-containing protein [Archangium sp.]|nr:pentapeptide repeat-containing protein [Archangium sp.]